MTLRSVIDIDIRDASWQRFQEKYEKYQEQLAKTPNAWKKVSQEHNALATNFERMTAAMMAQSEIAREQAARERKEESHLTLADRLWASMSRSTKSVASNITHATSALLKWSSLLTGVSGILGVGGLWGIDRLASSVSGERRTGMGLGMSVGALQAFRMDFGRFVDSDSFLNQLNQMETNPAKAWPLYAMGIKPSGDTTSDATRLLDAMRARALATPVSQLGLLSQQTGIDVDAATWRRMHDATAGEWAAQRSAFMRDRVAMNVPATATRGLQDLTTQFERAATTIKDTFATKLGALAPSITRLSSAFQNLAVVGINSILTKHNLQTISSWVDSLAKALKDPNTIKSFEQRLQSIKDDFGKMVDGFHWIATTLDDLRNHPGRVLADLAKSTGEASGKLALSGAQAAIGAMGKAQAFASQEGQKVGTYAAQESIQTGKWIAGGMHVSHLDAFERRFRESPTRDHFEDVLRALEKQRALPAGSLDAIWHTESSATLAPPDSKRGAAGPMQIEPWVARSYGADPATLRDPLTSATLSAQIVADNLAHYHGEIRKALAAYNLGSGKLDAIIAAHPSDWQRYVPRETQDYLKRIAGGGKVQLDVRVMTTPGSDITVAASQLAAQVPQ